jgi:tetratricopeptide (TPR) repeat protein
MTDAEAYARVRALFDAVAELPADERERRLQASGEDAEVVARVRSMLVASGATVELAAPVAAMLGTLANSEMEAGMRLGAWTLERKIGEGGMGTVYAARRSDGHFEQEAAIKLLRGLPSAAALEYLARERQILASLTHPNIARLLDGGTTPQGQPFLVMEYLDGVPIDRHCREQRPDTGALLRLLIPVCEAVAYAHARLVVHCDLKPSNILVRDDGRPCLLDFGIARVLGDADRAQPSSISRRARAFTPGFASPEQEAGGMVGTATDVYSLGRLLECLLAAAGREDDAELAAVVRRATAADPEARYPSAAALGADLARYRERQPLDAMPHTLGYVAKRFVSRHRQATAAALVAVLALALGVALAVSGYLQARAAQQVAEAAAVEARREAARSSTLAGFLTDMLSGVTPEEARGMDTTLLQRIFARAADRVEQQLGDDPALLLAASSVIGANLRLIGQPEASTQALEETLARVDGTPLAASADAIGARRALALALYDAGRDESAIAAAKRALADTRANPDADASDLAAALGDLAWVQQVVDTDAAVAQMREALDALGNTIAADDPLRTELELSLASILVNHRSPEEAQPLFDAVLPRLRAAYGDDHPKVMRAEAEQALAHLKRRDFTGAESILRPLLARNERVHGPDHYATLALVNNLGAALRQQGRTAEAAPYYERGYDAQLRLRGQDHPATVIALNNYALLRIDQGRAAEVIDALPQNLVRAQQAFPDNRRMDAEFRHTLARALAGVGRHAEALQAFEQCWQDMAASAGADSADAREIVAHVVAMSEDAGRTDWLATWTDRPR